jgi:DNA-binding MarR family transcriptional regulator
MAVEQAPTDEDYRQLADLRYTLRRFLSWSERQAAGEGLTAAQHQLLLAIRASREPLGPTVGEIAERLLLRHHSAVGLIDRAQSAGLVTRERDPDQRSLVRLRLTDAAQAKLAGLSEAHLRELAQLAPVMQALLHGIAEQATRR